MVEIIKRGTLPSERVYRTTCTECGTEFRFRASEAEKSRTSNVRDPTGCLMLTIACPLCSRPCYKSPEDDEEKR